MNRFISKEEMAKRVKKVALENMIDECNSGIYALKYYRANLRQQLEELVPLVYETDSLGRPWLVCQKCGRKSQAWSNTKERTKCRWCGFEHREEDKK